MADARDPGPVVTADVPAPVPPRVIGSGARATSQLGMAREAEVAGVLAGSGLAGDKGRCCG